MRKIPLLFSDVSFGTEEFGFIPTLPGEDPDDADRRYEKHLRDQGVMGHVDRMGNVILEGKMKTMKISESKLRQIIREEIEGAQNIIALALRPNYDRGYRMVRVEVDERTADATQSRGSVEARYSAPIADVADMIATDYPGETIRLDAAGYGYGGATRDSQANQLARALKTRGVKVRG